MTSLANRYTIGDSEAATVEDNNVFYDRLVDGDVSARDEMIERNVGLAVFRTETYLRSNPQMSYYREDMIGAALVGLCEAVDSMQKRRRIQNPKPTGYMTKTIDQHIQVVVDESNTIVVSYKAQRRARAAGTPIQPPRIVSEKAAIAKPDLSQRERINGDDLCEDIMTCCWDDVDRHIVEMRQEHTSDTTIGQTLGISQQEVSRRRKDIEARLIERCPEFKETERAKTKRLEKEAKATAKRAANKAAKKAAKEAVGG